MSQSPLLVPMWIVFFDFHVIPLKVNWRVECEKQPENRSGTKWCCHTISTSINFCYSGINFTLCVLYHSVKTCEGNSGVVRSLTCYCNRILEELIFDFIIAACSKSTKTWMSKVCTLNFILFSAFATLIIISLNQNFPFFQFRLDSTEFFSLHPFSVNIYFNLVNHLIPTFLCIFKIES